MVHLYFSDAHNDYARLLPIFQRIELSFVMTQEFITRPFILNKAIPWAVSRFNDSRQGKLLFPIFFDDVALPT